MTATAIRSSHAGDGERQRRRLRSPVAMPSIAKLSSRRRSRRGPRTPDSRRPLTDLRGVGAKLAACGRADRSRDDRRPDRACPARLDATAPRSARSRRSRRGVRRRVLVEVRKSRLRPTRRRNLRIVEATVADDIRTRRRSIWFNQAWLAERLRPGTRLLLSGRLDGAASGPMRTRSSTAPRAGERSAEPAARRPRIRPPASTRRASCRCIRAARASASSGCASGSGRRWRSRRDVDRATAGRAADPRTASRAPPTRALAIHFPRDREQIGPARAPARLRGALPAPGGAAAPPRRAPIGSARGAARRARGADRRLARVAAVRADRRSARARSRRSTPTSSGPSRCSGC